MPDQITGALLFCHGKVCKHPCMILFGRGGSGVGIVCVPFHRHPGSRGVKPSDMRESDMNVIIYHIFGWIWVWI
jgi:hypothetical protein